MQTGAEKDVNSNGQNGVEEDTAMITAAQDSTPPPAVGSISAKVPVAAAVQDELEPHSTIEDTSTTTLKLPDASRTSLGSATNQISEHPNPARAVMHQNGMDSEGRQSYLSAIDATNPIMSESTGLGSKQEASSRVVLEPPPPTSNGYGQRALPAPSETSIEQEWALKTIRYPPLAQYPSELKILVQDANGPCSFLALCNILILRGDIALPPDQNRASYSQLSSLVADFLLRRPSSSSPSSPNLPTNALDFALSILPKTLSGLDVNVDFISGGFSRPADAQPGELELFALAAVPIKHGWLASPEEEETYSILREHAKDYDAATAFVAEGDASAKGAVTSYASGMESSDVAGLFYERLSSLTLEEQTKVQQASLVHRFLQSTSTQLTYAGLFQLSETLSPGSLCALFRNAHFSVLFRHPATSSSDDTGALFTLVTDSALLHSRDCVWESLADTDGAASAFFDSDLKPARVRQDWVPRDAAQSEERNEDADTDTALAMQMQQDEYDREEYHRQRDAREQQERTQVGSQQQQPVPPDTQRTQVAQPPKTHPTTTNAPTSSGGLTKAKKVKPKKECIVS